MNTAIYLRKSTDSEDRQLLSLEDQLASCLETAKRNSLSVDQDSVYSESASAKKSGKRPIFRKILDQVHKGKISSIVVWSASRLARNASEGGELVDALNEKKLKIFHQGGIYDRGDSLLLHIELGFATQFVQGLSDDVTRGMNSKVEKGWRPGKSPVGYKNNVHEKKGEKTLSVDPETAPYVRRMFDLVLSGRTVEETREIVSNEGFRLTATNKRPRRVIGVTQCYRLLQNPFYFGWYFWKNEMRKGKHEPLVPKSEFDRVQELISSRANTHKIKNDFWWMGLVRCKCGSAVTPETKNRKLKSGGHQWHSYARCGKKHGPCDEKYIPVKDFETDLLNFLKANTITEVAMKRIKDELTERNEREFELAEKRQKQVTRLKNDIFEKKRELYGLKTEGLIGEEEFLKRKNKILSEEAGLSEEDISLKLWLKDVETVASFAYNLQRIFDEGDNETKKNIFQIIGAGFVLDRGRVWCKVKNTFEALKESSLVGQEATHKLGTTEKITTSRSGWGESDPRNQIGNLE